PPPQQIKEFVGICVQDPRLHKDDHWHTHVDYEICLHVSAAKSNGCVSLFGCGTLPPWNPFFCLKNRQQVDQRMKGLQEFLEIVLQNPLLLSDSHLHLFLQSDLSISRIERCALGKTRYTVAEAIQRSRCGYAASLEDKTSFDSDYERLVFGSHEHVSDSDVD
uniref:Sorting nexin 10a n=1 Tax=Nothobranchius furzeri TaxID=105023 RepID=A0A8C6KZX3_NOTFU